MMKPRAHVHFVTGKQVDHFFFRFILSLHIPEKTKGMNQASKDLKNGSRLYPKDVALEHGQWILHEVNDSMHTVKKEVYRKIPSSSKSLFS